jgi:predicted nucleic acid-binding protein
VKYLLDACVISESIRPKPEAAVIEWLASQYEGDFYLCALTLGELEKGVEKLRHGTKRSRLELWIKELENRFGSRILPIDGSVAIHWGHLAGSLESKGKALPVIDGLIASCAIGNGMVLATRNVQDYYLSGVELFNPWDLKSK